MTVESGCLAAVLGPNGAFIDPTLDQSDFRVGELAAHRHPRQLPHAGYAAVERAPTRFMRNDPLAGYAVRENNGLRVESQPAELLVGPVAGIAFFAEDRLDIADEIDVVRSGNGDQRDPADG